MADETTHDEFDVPSSSGLDSAAPTSGPAPEPAASEPTAEPAVAPQPSPLSERLRREGLREIQGETTEQTFDRLTQHYEGKSKRFYADLKRQQEGHASELAAIRAYVEPLARAHFEQQQAARTAQLAAEIPEKGTPEYQEWLLEQVLLQDQERQEAQAQAAQEREQEAVRQQFAQIDEQGYQLVAQGLGQVDGNADPELVEAYGAMTRIAYNSAKAAFPGADEDDIIAFMDLAQKLDIRNWMMAGQNPAVAIKQRYNEMRGILGAQAPVQQQAQTQPVTQRPIEQPVAQPSPTAARVQAEAAAAAKRLPVTAAAPARPTPAGGLPDPSAFEDSDDYVEAVLAGVLGNERQRTQMHERFR